MSMTGGTAVARPMLFQTRAPRRHFVGPLLLVLGLHVGVIAWSLRRLPPPVQRPEPVRVALKLPIRKVAVNEPAGGGTARPARAIQRRHVRHKRVTPPIAPPPLVERPPVPDPPPVAEEEDAGDDDGDDGATDGTGTGTGSGGGVGTGSGPGVGPGRGSIKSKARKAWLARTDWNCKSPAHVEGDLLIHIRVEVLLDGRPGAITIVKPGPEEFNRRAIECARDEKYLPALDPEGTPIPGAAEFSIRFLN